MNHDEAETTRTQLRRRERCGIRWTALPLAVVLVAFAAALVSCTTVEKIGTPSGGTALTVIAAASPAPTETPAPLDTGLASGKPGYRLVFDDEFDGSKVDGKRWATSLPWGNTNRDEQQYYTPQALSQRAGILTITARKKTTHGKPYASGVITSSRRFSFTYGYAEIRAQVPAGKGLWSAFWLPAPGRGNNEEVDVMEVVGSDPSVGRAVLHYGTTADKKRSMVEYPGPDYSTGFHTFAIDWAPDHMIWYADGVERYRVSQNIPSDPMYLIANLTVGGPTGWPGPADRYTTFPAQYKIDYIRVFQRQ